MSYEKNGEGTGGFDEAYVRNIHLFTNPAKRLRMGENVFRDCSSLMVVDIQRRQVHSGSNLFFNTPNLSDVTINSDRPYFSWFNGHTAIQRLTLGDKVHTIPSSGFSGCTSLREVNLSDAIAFIYYRAFYNCQSLTTVKLPAALTRIDIETFRGCTKLGSIEVPPSVQEIGYNAFYDCYALKSFQVPEGVKTLRYGTFRYNHALNSISLPSTLESIGQYALDNCENLTTLVLPEKVESIDAEAFTNCGLNTFYVYNPTPITFGDTNPFSTYFAQEGKELTLYVPADALDAYKGKKIWQQFNDEENGRKLLPIDVAC